MAFLPGLVKLVKKVARPLGKIIEEIPVIGTPFKAAQNISAPIVSGVQKALKLVKKIPLPAATAAGGLAAGAGIEAGLGGAPALPGGGAMVPYQGGAVSPFDMAAKGKGALLNPNMAAAIQSVSIPATDIPYKYNPPRGYVIVHTQYGGVLCIPRSIAVHFGLWHAGRKPPISAGDWHKYQTAQRVEKKLRHLAIHAMRHHHAKAAKQTGRK